jgi:UDP-glucose 4-epimerase
LGSGTGFSVKEIVTATREALHKPDFAPGTAARREGDPSILIASNKKAGDILGWKPQRSLTDIITDAATWHRSPRYREAIRTKIGKNPFSAL